ncbi:MAG TPA: SDR family oxidoreductase [Candidatus Paceibacterota bacterium]|nr:SDR family oxidoreductase [Candidatus Paceibacterota bacterium]
MGVLENKKAVVIGGSRGIGKEIARAYLREGASVILMARKPEELAAAQSELSPLGEVLVSAGDVSREDEVARVAGEAGKAWGRVDVLVNAAAVSGPIGPVTDVDPAQWLQALEVNLFGTFLSMRAFGAMMKQANKGSIINFSGGGEGAYENFTSYVSAKGGVVRLTETAGMELAPYHIRVNAIAPGAVNTQFLADLIAAGPEKAGAANYERALKQKGSGGASPEKAAGLCVFLASDASEGLTGRTLSAMWDAYEDIPAHLNEIATSDIYTFRRVIPKQKGFDWGEHPKG